MSVGALWVQIALLQSRIATLEVSRDHYISGLAAAEEERDELRARVNELQAELRDMTTAKWFSYGQATDLAAECDELRKDNKRLVAILAASCDEERNQLWEAGPGGGCSRALDAENELDKLRALLAGSGKITLDK